MWPAVSIIGGMRKTIVLVPIAGIVAAAIVVALAPHPAFAQLPRMGPPLATTVVISKPAPGQIYGNRQVITMGVEGKTYKFVLKDAWANDPSGKIHWDDIWQQVRQYTPNMMVTGMNSDTFEKIKPGDTMTINGLYAPLNRNFEVIGTESGSGPYAPAQHY
ncbi:MAG TPA: hypothetical protein VMU16_06520 [Candidatus Binataceae bacterium]|nr:hypothetical protein [Candidatus Binataceae bacterium]